MHSVYGLERAGANAVPTLIDALKDPHWQVRIGAIDALTTIGDRRAITPLRAATRDAHALVREEAVAALAKLER
jgi:HEAT repeat protein